jgi:hypothetical protein
MKLRQRQALRDRDACDALLGGRAVQLLLDVDGHGARALVQHAEARRAEEEPATHIHTHTPTKQTSRDVSKCKQQQQHSSGDKGHRLDCVCCNVCAPGHGEALLLPQGQSLLPHPHSVPAAALRNKEPFVSVMPHQSYVSASGMSV